MKEDQGRARFRALLNGSGSSAMASIFDPLSARIAEELGFEAGLMGGSLVSQVLLAAPDVTVLTLTELADHVARCARVSSVPILVDADHGYGNALNVMRTIEELDRAGAAAVKVEDTLLPRAYGATEAQALLSFEEAQGKMRAAVRARGTSDLVVVGRTNALAISGADEAGRRLGMFESAGVDALFIPTAGSREELDRICEAISLPLILGTATGDLADSAYLASRKVRLWSGGHQAFGIALKALHDAMSALRRGTRNDELLGVAPKELVARVMRVAAYDEATREFLGGRGGAN